MKKAPAFATAALIGISALSLAACSSEHSPKRERGAHAGKEFRKGGMERGFKDLNLSEEQKTKIRAIMEEGRSQNERRRHPDESVQGEQQRRAEAYRAAEQNLLKNPVFDEAAARNLIARRGQEMEARRRSCDEAELQQLKKRHAVFQVLTPEQQQKWLEKQQKRGGQKPQRHGR